MAARTNGALRKDEEGWLMPLYEYQCDDCGRRFELIRKFSDPPLEACPTCGGGVRKLMSTPAFQFKGSGWYVTDYARKDQTAASPSEDGRSDAPGKEKAAEKDGKPSEKSDKAEKADTGDKDAKPPKGDAAPAKA